jgi:two-component system, OmpR family, phosphate regulon sensor histidine kinase PhoR
MPPSPHDPPDDRRAHPRPPIRLVQLPTELEGAATRSEDELRAIRSRILNVVGHELRTPTTTLRGLADVLDRIDPATAADHVIPAIQRNAARLERLVDDLLIATGITTALPVGRPEPLNVNALVLVLWAEVGDPGGLSLRSPDGPHQALAHPKGVEGALHRILENAVRLGERPVTVTVTGDGSAVEVVVDSPGPALHPEEVELAMELLFRGENAVMRAPGLGLGLPVARALVEHSGGELTVAARDGGGFLTTMRLRAAEAAP